MEPTQKILVSPDALPGLAGMMVMGHPDTQQHLHRPKSAAYEDLPRSIEVVEQLALGEPFDTFAQGQGAIYLSSRAAGSDTLEGLDKSRRLGAEGQSLGTFGNTSAGPVDKKVGGCFTFGTRVKKPANEAVPRVSLPEEEKTPEALVIKAGAPPVADGSAVIPTLEVTSAPVEEGEAPVPEISFLKKGPLGPILFIDRMPELEGGGPRSNVDDVGVVPPRFSMGKTSPKGAAPEVTLPAWFFGKKRKKTVDPVLTKSKPKPIKVVRPEASGEGLRLLPQVGPFGALAWLAAGVLLAGLGLRSHFLRPQVLSPEAYLGWEESQLRKELQVKQAAHEARLSEPSTRGRLDDLEREERELALLSEAAERIHGKRSVR